MAELTNADLRRADLCGAKLIEANLRKAILSGADLRAADLSSGRDVADLSRADLRGAYLTEANLHKAILREANLGGAHLSRAILRGAYLREADLRADLRYAKLRDADLRAADLQEANLSQATVGVTAFANVDLSLVLGLESVEHRGPSYIGIDTIYRSKGQISEIFLRKAGVPEPVIVQMKALVGALEPIQFYSCFISYSSKDQEFAERLYADLQAKGVRCWFAPEDLKIGDRFQESIEESIRVFDKVMMICQTSL